MKCTLVTVIVSQLGPGGLFGVARRMLSDAASGKVCVLVHLFMVRHVVRVRMGPILASLTLVPVA